MDWLIFWGITVGYWAIGISRVPTYFQRWLASSRAEWKYRSEQEHHRSAAWTAIGLMCIWPYYEAGRWFRDTLIHSLTKEERTKAEYEKAQRIVAEYTKQKEAEARADFDKKLRGK